MKRVLKNGFSIIEMLIGTVIAGVLMLTVTSVTSSLYKQMADIEALNGLTNTVVSVTSTLAHQTLCRGAVLANNPAVDLAKAATAAGAPFTIGNVAGLIADNSEIPSSKIKIETVRFANATVTGVDGAGNNIYSGNLILRASRLGASPDRPSVAFAPRDLGVVSFIVNAAGTLVDCYDNNSAQAMCIKLGGTYNVNAAQPCTLADTKTVCDTVGGTFDANKVPPCQVVASNGGNGGNRCRMRHVTTSSSRNGGNPCAGGTLVNRTCTCTNLFNSRCTSTRCDNVCYICN